MQELNSWLAEAACQTQVSNEGNISEVMSTDIVLSLGNKVRVNLLQLS